jgi:hypothetical protein
MLGRHSTTWGILPAISEILNYIFKQDLPNYIKAIKENIVWVGAQGTYCQQALMET